MKVEFSRKIFEKYSNFKCHEDLSIGSSDCMGTYGQMDRQTWRS